MENKNNKLRAKFIKKNYTKIVDKGRQRQVMLVVGNQAFDVALSMTFKEAQWMRDMLVHALLNLIDGVEKEDKCHI